jgi:hypothetical protein
MDLGRKEYTDRIIDKEGKIPENEPCFFLRGTDSFAPELMLLWASKLRLAGGNPLMARMAEDHAQKMIEYQRANGSKVPDMYSGQDQKDKLLYPAEVIIAKWLKSGELGEGEFKQVSETLKEYFLREDLCVVLTTQDMREGIEKEDIKDIKLDDFDINPMTIEKSILVLFINKKYIKVLKYKRTI